MKCLKSIMMGIAFTFTLIGGAVIVCVGAMVAGVYISSFFSFGPVAALAFAILILMTALGIVIGIVDCRTSG